MQLQININQQIYICDSCICPMNPLNSCLCVYCLMRIHCSYKKFDLEGEDCNSNMVMNLGKLKNRIGSTQTWLGMPIGLARLWLCVGFVWVEVDFNLLHKPLFVVFLFFFCSVGSKNLHMIVNIVKLVEGFDLILKFNLNGLIDL